MTGGDLEEVRQPRGHREEAVPGSRMESRQDRKLWGHEQGRVTADLALNGATVAALLRMHCREPRSSRQRDDGQVVMDVVVLGRGLENRSGFRGRHFEGGAPRGLTVKWMRCEKEGTWG